MKKLLPLCAASLIALAARGTAQDVPADGPALGSDRITQADIESGNLSMRQMRRKGMEIFSTPFNLLDGFGDGPMNPADPSALGGRPTFQTGQGVNAQPSNAFLRLNGLDSQTCLECHSVASNRSLPARFEVGGVGGISASAFPGVKDLDLDDTGGNGFAAIDGRVINPPFVFGAGGVELLAKEMTVDLQNAKSFAQSHPGTVVSLDSKGVNFGSISYDDVSDTFDTSSLEGIDDDLVVKPFGRKGNNETIRVFDTGAMRFHHGMQPVEAVGEGVDDDGDGVVNEILVGELSAIHVFSVNLKRPRQERRPGLWKGYKEFQAAGCADCHVPRLDTETRHLPLAFPEVHTDPWANTYAFVDLGRAARFRRNSHGGVRVNLFSDLKRHRMGPVLEESTGDGLDPWFITPRLWGVADTAPYLHDGRAMTLRDAILMHGGEGQSAADNFAALGPDRQEDLLGFLGTLRTPLNPSRDLDGGHGDDDRDHDD